MERFGIGFVLQFCFVDGAEFEPPGCADNFAGEEFFETRGGGKLLEEGVAHMTMGFNHGKRNEIAFGVEAEFGGVLGDGGFALGSGGSGGVDSVVSIGEDLVGGGHDLTVEDVWAADAGGRVQMVEGIKTNYFFWT